MIELESENGSYMPVCIIIRRARKRLEEVNTAE
jgi:hypothetical protein